MAIALPRLVDAQIFNLGRVVLRRHFVTRQWVMTPNPRPNTRHGKTPRQYFYAQLSYGYTTLDRALPADADPEQPTNPTPFPNRSSCCVVAQTSPPRRHPQPQNPADSPLGLLPTILVLSSPSSPETHMPTLPAHRFRDTISYSRLKTRRMTNHGLLRQH